MSITFNELLHGNLISDVPLAHQHNLEELLIRINKVRDAWAKPMIVTSGYRTWAEHADIYRRINLRKGLPPDANIPKQSAHLSGCAVDIADADGNMYKWLQENQGTILVANDLWVETGTKGWCHYQIYPPKSGERFFNP